MRPVVALMVLLAPLPAAAAPQLSVGFAEVDVSPAIGAKPVFLAGYGENRRATTVHDPITARAVVLSDGTDKVALVAVDVVGLFLPAVENVRAQLPGFKYVLVSATHNHEGPDTLGLWGPTPFASGVDPDYLKRVEDGAAKAVTLAAAALKPATAEIGTARDPDLLHDARLPVVKHDEMVVLRFRDPATKALLGLLVQWNCHPELLGDKNTEVSADHVYYTVKALKDRHRCPVAYFTGTVGGLMTSLHVPLKGADGKELKDGTFEKTEKYGTLVADLADKALAAAGPVNLLPLEVRTRGLLVPVDNALYRVAWQVGKLKRAMYEWDGNPTRPRSRSRRT